MRMKRSDLLPLHVAEQSSGSVWWHGQRSCRGTGTEYVSVPLLTSVVPVQCEGQRVRLTAEMCETVWLKVCGDWNRRGYNSTSVDDSIAEDVTVLLVEGVSVVLCVVEGVMAWLYNSVPVCDSVTEDKTGWLCDQ